MFTRIISFISSSRRDILILFTALFNRNTPKMIKTMTIVAFLYLISPIDFLPDMIPGLGLFYMQCFRCYLLLLEQNQKHRQII